MLCAQATCTSHLVLGWQVYMGMVVLYVFEWELLKLRARFELARRHPSLGYFWYTVSTHSWYHL